jgi:hypothetical protein
MQRPTPQNPRTKRVRCLAVEIIAKSPESKRYNLLLSPEQPSEFVLDEQYAIKLEREEQVGSGPVYDLTIRDPQTHRLFSPPIQCPFLPHSETVASFLNRGIQYTASITPQIIEQPKH